MGLHDDSRSAFLAGSSRFCHDDVADSISFGIDVMFFGKIEKESADFLLFLRRTGHLVNLVENTKHQCRLEIFDCHVSESLLLLLCKPVRAA